LRSQWLHHFPALRRTGPQVEHLRGIRAWYDSWAWRGGDINLSNLQFINNAPTYNDPYGSDCYIRVYPDAQEDAGATVQIFGIDSNGQRLMTRDTATGLWSDGITITVPEITPDTPYGSSSVKVREIHRVVKSVTQNNLRLYAYDSVNDWLLDLAVYEPSETSPSYVRYTLNTCGPRTYASCSSDSGCLRTIVALVKLKPVPVRVSSDWVIIDNEEALLNAIRALKSAAANSVDLAQAQKTVAIEELNRSLEDASPDAQMAVRNNVFAGKTFQNQGW
jgi:hypothetical protein